MGNSATFIPATAEHIERVNKRMLYRHVAECALLHIKPEIGLRQSVKESALCLALVVDGDAVAIIGATPANSSGLGVLWMLCADDFRRGFRFLLRSGRGALEDLFAASGAKVLANVFSSMHVRRVVWLKRFGAEFVSNPAPSVVGQTLVRLTLERFLCA